MWWYPETGPMKWSICRSTLLDGPFGMVGYRRIRWEPLHNTVHFMWDTNGGGWLKAVELVIPPHHRPSLTAWACGDMPSFVFADWLEDHGYDVPGAILALLREPCENPAEVGV